MKATDILNWTRAWAVLTVLISCNYAVAAKVEVGGQSISLPPPDSLVQAVASRMLQAGEVSTIKEDRLLAVFATEDTVRQETKGGVIGLDRYAFAQATRNTEPYQIPLERFAKYKSDSKSELAAGMTPEVMAEAKKGTDRTSKWVEAAMGVKSQIEVPRLGATMILDETPTSLTMVVRGTTAVSIGGGKQKTVEQMVGMSQILVRSKVVWLQLYTRFDSREDFDWVSKNIVKWTRAVLAANP